MRLSISCLPSVAVLVLLVAATACGERNTGHPGAAGGSSTTCLTSELECNSGSDASAACIDPLTDNANCGCCGNVCGATQTCVGGRCESAQFGFFVFGDLHAGSAANLAIVQLATQQMRQIDPNAIAAFSNGDMVDSPSAAQWTAHDAAIEPAAFRADTACPTAFGEVTRYFATPGDHDVSVGNWLTFWDAHLPGQAHLGQHASDRVYYSLSYGNSFFVMLDTEHVSSAQTSWQDAQTTWLRSVLESSEGQAARLKFVFLHQAVYSCSGHHAPFAAALPWVDLAEQNKVNVLFGSHTHVYSRTCPKQQGACTSDGTGVIFVETGPLGGGPRDFEGTTATAEGTDASGNARSDTYNCTVGQDLAASNGGQNTFCHVAVDDCQARIDCYLVADGNTAPFDSWTVDGCGN